MQNNVLLLTIVGIHAREWIAPMSTMYSVEQLVDRFEEEENGKEDPVTELEWYVIPLLNPDGYEYSRTSDRMWRKNRAVNAGSDCRGVDLNRNWAAPGFSHGASKDPCSDIYDGGESETQPEVRAAEGRLMKLKDKVRAALSVHSYGSYWLIPWGYKKKASKDEEKMRKLGDAAVEAIRKVNGRNYEVGAAGIIFSPAGGASDDFAKARAHVPYSVTIELAGDDG